MKTHSNPIEDSYLSKMVYKEQVSSLVKLIQSLKSYSDSVNSQSN